MSNFSKVLIANRGEIACRVIRTAKAMGYRTVAVYSDADRDAPHVWAADEAVRIGPAPVGESYLLIDNILAAARSCGADAIHPGYGFLAENAAFSRACDEAGITFIGPAPDAVELMGNKRAAKIRMIEAGVPCVPGYEGADQSDDVLVAEGRKIGCPVMVKAAAGGGGRGMRLVQDEAKLLEGIQSARSEGKNAFGSGELILEKAVVGARHVEIQVFADTHGNAVHLGERDCSVQRRHQKVVEEAPSPAVDEALRQRMGQAAVDAAKAINYRGAGTVEFLLGQDGEFYFMEMNTRLQVEHPVTEMITGLDLVEWQLRVAQGETLPLAQEQIRFNGHAIEVRLCAEDPQQDFLPQTGTLLRWSPPADGGVRTDHGIREGQVISPFYDSMQAKVIAHAPTRDGARRKLIKGLAHCEILGVVSNRDVLSGILQHEVFASGDYNTGFIQEHYADRLTGAEVSHRHTALAAILVTHIEGRKLADSAGLSDGFMNWRSSNRVPIISKLAVGDASFDVQVLAVNQNRYEVTVEGETLNAEITALTGRDFHFAVDGVQGRALYALEGNRIWLDAEAAIQVYTDQTLPAPSGSEAGGDGRLLAPMDGKVLAVHAAVGDAVTKGQVLAVVEAMKMEQQIVSGVDGTVATVEVAAGDQVKARQLLVAVDPAESADD